MLQNARTSSRAVVHFIIFTPLQNNTQSVSSTICIGCATSIFCKSSYSWLSLLPSTLIVNKSSNFKSHRPLLSRPRPVTRKHWSFYHPKTHTSPSSILSELFLHIQPALWWILYPNEYIVSWEYISPNRYPDLTNVSHTSVPRTILLNSAAISRTCAKNIFIVFSLEIFIIPAAKLAVEHLHTPNSKASAISTNLIVTHLVWHMAC